MADANKGNDAAHAGAPKQKTARTRSPAYPGINLETAIKRALELYAQDRMNAVPIAIAVKRWGFKEKSSGGLVAIAALKSFGLIKDSGSGKDRKLQLTEEARRILLDQREESPERVAAIKQAALRPKIHTALWNKWGANVPPDDSFSHELIFERAFNENSVRDFIKEYKDTIRFAKLTESDTLSAGSEDMNQESDMGIVDQKPKKTPMDWLPPAGSGITRQQPSTKEISMPVGVSEDGQVIFAHVYFDGPLKKEYLVSLRALLQALEGGFKVDTGTAGGTKT